MSSKKRDRFTSSFTIWMTFVSFSSLIALFKPSKTMLNRSVESGHSCLAPDLKGNAFNFPALSIMLAVGSSYIPLLC